MGRQKILDRLLAGMPDFNLRMFRLSQGCDSGLRPSGILLCVTGYVLVLA